MNIFRAILGLSAGILGAALIPVYSAPFSGCEATGFLADEAGCSSWPEFMRGFVFVICCTLAPVEYRLPLIALLVLFLLAFLGGVESIMTGEYFRFSTTEPFSLFAYWALIGGFLAYVVYRLIHFGSVKYAAS